MKKRILILVAMVSLVASVLVAEDPRPRILAMGDSMMAWHNVSGRSIPQVISNELGEPVVSQAIGGARIIYNLPISGAMGMKITNQYRKGDWDWIVVNGGGNDLWLGCGCTACDKRLNRMISDDGKKGVVPGMVSNLRQSGARVIYVGYLRSPGVGSVIDSCRPAGDEFEARIEAMSKLDKGLYFVSIADLVPHGDRSFHGVDMIHPSVKGSAAIGKRLAEVIKANE
ncbi:SGNH/GDSL hydrolase family protein [Shimia sediminis]|uniref:SGNH/GDSL hydrolase family protein n=1 Tax=Shimia sediminis TaxID=2497945 RepID=UPI0013E0A04E|nr:SGNH/GDSL hydrolase family protein [Shimia sediminis]